jgi:hypothetical protein
MPYKDLERKREWERQHRSQRLARRRELRQIATARKEAHPEAITTQHSGAGFLLPVVAGGALAAYSPKLGMGVGGLMLLVAAIHKKGGSWWIVGIIILVLSLFFQWNDQTEEK